MNSEYWELLEKFFKTEIIEDYSLKKIQKACEYFGNPQNIYKSIHIAGTNGKGSVSKMIFQILKESGKKVWVYTSPHNIDIRERFETENWLITEKDFTKYANQIIQYGEWLSYYERCTLLAFLYFRDIGCEYVVMEVGMWWRLDATNILTPILSIITSISYDHMEFLGDTLEAIAWEKWGIIKPWIPVILYEKNPTLEIIANNKQSLIIYPEKRNITTNLVGLHQLSNARIAYEAGVFCGIQETIITQALTHVDHPGRLQYLRSNLLIDGAHNEDGMKQLRKYLEWESQKWENTIYSFNLKKWKNASLVLDIFDNISSWNIIDSEWFQVNDATLITSEMQKSWKNSTIITPSDIFSQTENNPRTLFVVFGSLYMLREFLEW
jgi:dihydrofolate synthase/folylpolyglutamate synthase